MCRLGRLGRIGCTVDIHTINPIHPWSSVDGRLPALDRYSGGVREWATLKGKRV